MKVLMFQPQFVEGILNGTKCTTIRPRVGDRPCRFTVGDRVSARIWADKPYRSKQLEFGKRVIDKIQSITLNEKSIVVDDLRLVETPKRRSLDIFAKYDGFADWPAMLAWFADNHGNFPFLGWRYWLSEGF